MYGFEFWKSEALPLEVLSASAVNFLVAMVTCLKLKETMLFHVQPCSRNFLFGYPLYTIFNVEMSVQTGSFWAVLNEV